MSVRFAIKADVPALVELGREAHVESRYAWLSYSPERVWEQIDKAIQRNHHCCLVAHDAKQEPYGFLHGYAEEYFFARARAARLEFLYILPKRRGGLDAMKMLAGFRQWAVKKEVVEIRIDSAMGVETTRTDRLFKRLGFQMVGGNYSRWID